MSIMSILRRTRRRLVPTQPPISSRIHPVSDPIRAVYLVKLVVKRNLRVEKVAEVGVWRGHTSLVLLQQLPSIKEYHLIDPWEVYDEYIESGDNKANAQLPLAQRQCTMYLQAHRSKLVWHKAYSVQAAQTIPDASLDLVFIDANHAYEYVKEDIESWMPKVRKGGILAGHDLDLKDAPGVRKAVTEAFGDSWNLGDEKVWWIDVQ